MFWLLAQVWVWVLVALVLGVLAGRLLWPRPDAPARPVPDPEERP